MLYRITDEEGRNIAMNEFVWTPELDKQLFRDLNEYVVETGNIWAMGLLCRKYNCTIGAITQRIDEIHSRTLAEVTARFAAFKATRMTGAAPFERGTLPHDLTAIQLT
jgi:hypothetical protein